MLENAMDEGTPDIKKSSNSAAAKSGEVDREKEAAARRIARLKAMSISGGHPH